MNKSKTIELYEKIKANFMGSGLNYWQTFEVLLTLDAYIFALISHELIETLDDQKKSELDKLLDGSPDSSKLAEFLGVTIEELNIRHDKKLEQFLEELSMTAKPIV